MWGFLVILVGTFVCVVLLISSVAVGFSFLLVPILVAEIMLLSAVYVMRRALGDEDTVFSGERAWQLAAALCVLLIVSSVLVGLSFLIFPLLVAMAMLLGVVYLARQSIESEGPVRPARAPWYARAESLWAGRPESEPRGRPEPPWYVRSGLASSAPGGSAATARPEPGSWGRPEPVGGGGAEGVAAMRSNVRRPVRSEPAWYERPMRAWFPQDHDPGEPVPRGEPVLRGEPVPRRTGETVSDEAALEPAWYGGPDNGSQPPQRQPLVERLYQSPPGNGTGEGADGNGANGHTSPRPRRTRHTVPPRRP